MLTWVEKNLEVSEGRRGTEGQSFSIGQRGLHEFCSMREELGMGSAFSTLSTNLNVLPTNFSHRNG